MITGSSKKQKDVSPATGGIWVQEYVCYSSGRTDKAILAALLEVTSPNLRSLLFFVVVPFPFIWDG